MNLVNIVYKYVNHFIDNEELVELLSNIDKSDLSKNDQEKQELLLQDVKKNIETEDVSTENNKDSKKLYDILFNVLVNNPLYINCCKNMNSEELLEMITQYIYAPLTPNIDQELFNELISVAIKEDKRESLFRLASNYREKNKDFTYIEDYFIEKRDDYYLIELISLVEDELNIDKLAEKIISTKDEQFITKILNSAKDICCQRLIDMINNS